MHLSRSTCTSTLKANSYITSSTHYATKAFQLFHTSTPAHNFSPQLQNLVELQILCNIPQTPINIYNLHRELLSHPDQTYVQALISNLQHGCDIGYRDRSLHMSATTLLQHLSNQKFYLSPQDYTLSYCSVDDAFVIVSSLGCSALMAKIDLRNAFRLIPVWLQDWNLLEIKWRVNST